MTFKGYNTRNPFRLLQLIAEDCDALDPTEIREAIAIFDLACAPQRPPISEEYVGTHESVALRPLGRQHCPKSDCEANTSGTRPANGAEHPQVELLMQRIFGRARDPRSPEYQAGCRALLERRIQGTALVCPHALGTAQADAWYAGLDEGQAHLPKLETAPSHSATAASSEISQATPSRTR